VARGVRDCGKVAQLRPLTGGPTLASMVLVLGDREKCLASLDGYLNKPVLAPELQAALEHRERAIQRPIESATPSKPER